MLAVFTLSGLNFYGQLLEQLSAASLSLCDVTHCYCYTVVYFVPLASLSFMFPR